MLERKAASDGTLLGASLLMLTAIIALQARAQTPPGSADAERAAITAPTAGDADAGAEVYRSVCKECHGNSLAPTLRGVIGRPIASVTSFDYSDGLLAKKSMTWTRENLDTFLNSPQDFAPGTEMKKKDLNPQARADVIAYLATLPPPK